VEEAPFIGFSLLAFSIWVNDLSIIELEYLSFAQIYEKCFTIHLRNHIFEYLNKHVDLKRH